jgi:hypothetical protein
VANCNEHSGLCMNIRNLQDKCEELHKVNEDQWTAINNLRNRLPVWATITLMIMSALIGVMGTKALG